MPDLTLGVTITRQLLGLSDLNINDHINFFIGAQFMGANVTWQRNQVSSPFLDGQVTTQRNRQTVMEQVDVEVLGTSQDNLRTNLQTLLDAVLQEVYTLSVTIGGTNYAYLCEPADYQLLWTGPRWISKQVGVTLQIPRHPIPLVGELAGQHGTSSVTPVDGGNAGSNATGGLPFIDGGTATV